MVHLPPAEWHDGDERAVDGKAERVGQARMLAEWLATIAWARFPRVRSSIWRMILER
jgi:hypothetical protein